mgnify:CR=1 FL=1
MTEKILTNKKHGMAMLIFFLLLMAAAIVSAHPVRPLLWHPER